jgi:hypothetical protein
VRRKRLRTRRVSRIVFIALIDLVHWL